MTLACVAQFQQIGSLAIEVLLDGERLRNCPLEASVHHGLTHPPACLTSVVSQAGMRLVGIVEIPVEFGIQARPCPLFPVLLIRPPRPCPLLMRTLCTYCAYHA